MDRKGLKRSNTYGFFDISGSPSAITEPKPFLQLTTEAIQLELIDPVDCFGILPVVLDEVDVVGGGQEAREC